MCERLRPEGTLARVKAVRPLENSGGVLLVASSCCAQERGLWTLTTCTANATVCPGESAPPSNVAPTAAHCHRTQLESDSVGRYLCGIGGAASTCGLNMARH